MTDYYDYLLKLIIIGDAACGKSCLLYRFTNNKFKTDSQHTVGVEFGSKTIEANGKMIKQQIWVLLIHRSKCLNSTNELNSTYFCRIQPVRKDLGP